MLASTKTFDCSKFPNETYKLLSHAYGIMKDDQLMRQESKRVCFAGHLNITEYAAQKAIQMYNNPSEVSKKKKRDPHFKKLSTEYVLAVKDIVAMNNKEGKQNTVKSIVNKLHEIHDFDVSNLTLLRDLHFIGLKYKTGDRKISYTIQLPRLHTHLATQLVELLISS